MDIRQMQYFIEICRQKSFAKAAERLYISQQGLSMAISRSKKNCPASFSALGQRASSFRTGKFLLPHADEIIRQFQSAKIISRRLNRPSSSRKPSA
jgi:DNA-binding transcriptional LysR family regulator